MPDIEKLRDARLSDLQDKYEKMMVMFFSIFVLWSQFIWQ